MSDGGMIDWTQFKSEDFTYQGNYRAIVENNADPQKAGRVQVRIYGLHSPLSTQTPVEDLPWASPCLKTSWSGGHNMVNKESTDTITRYNPGNASEATIPTPNETQLTPPSGLFIDPVEDDCGTGGIFEVPRKGSVVWVFFEGGSHTTPHYFGMSPKQQDWTEQSSKITSDVNDKISQVADLRTDFTPDKTLHTGNGPAASAGVQTFCSTPRMSIYPIDGLPYQNITSFTSANGTTFIIVNDPGNERIYIMNKGTLTHVNEYGHKKELVGQTNAGGTTIDSNDEKLVAGHSELHVLGDYDLFVGGNCFIQVQGNCQINAELNVGVVAKSGDVDVIVESGNCNLEVSQGNMNANIGGNLQVQVGGNSIAVIEGNSSATIAGNMLASVEGTVNITSDDMITLKSETGITLDAGAGSVNILGSEIAISSDTEVNINVPVGLNVQTAASSFRVDPLGFGGDIALFVPISNAFHTGCFPGPGAGPSIPYIGVAPPAVPGIPAVPMPFIVSVKEEPVIDNVSAAEQTNDVDSPNDPTLSTPP
jgi:hypothetical protein